MSGVRYIIIIIINPSKPLHFTYIKSFIPYNNPVYWALTDFNFMIRKQIPSLKFYIGGIKFFSKIQNQFNTARFNFPEALSEHVHHLLRKC